MSLNRDFPGYVIRLHDGIYLVEGPNQSRFPFCNAFLFTGSETALIDTGIGAERIREIDAITRIDTLVISHSHPDHILAWHALTDRRIVYPAETPPTVHDLVDLGERFTGSRTGGEYWAEKIGRGLGIHPLREPDSRYSNGDILEFGPSQLEAIRTPGHLSDHYCFFERISGILFTTDIDFSRFGPWYGNPESDLDVFIDDVKQVMALPYRQVCGAHKSAVAAGDAEPAFAAYLAAFDAHRDLVLTQCGVPTSIDALVDASPFYNDRFPDKTLQRIFEKNMIEKHVVRLIREGRITRAAHRIAKIM